jgi:hypothetical protein
LVIVKPDTVIGWHRAGFRLYWRWRSRPRGGRPKISGEVRDLIQRLAQENRDWGAPKIHGELQKLGFVVAERSVARYLRRIRRRGDPASRWLTFLQNHRESRRIRLLHCAHGDVPVAVLLLCDRARAARILLHVTRHPTASGSSNNYARLSRKQVRIGMHLRSRFNIQ